MPERVRIAGPEFGLVDLSSAISNSTAAFEPDSHEIVYEDNANGAGTMTRLLGEGLEFPGETPAADETVTLPTHCGTHVYAPYHYGPESGGAPAQTVDEVLLDWWFGDGFVIDMTANEAGDSITDVDIEAALSVSGHEVREGEITLIRTDVRPGMRRSAVAWLVERGVRVIGIDAWGMDRPFPVMARELAARDTEQLWEVHLYGREHPYCQNEKLATLAALPADGFIVSAFPVKLERTGGSWVRVVAFVPGDAE